MTALVEHRETFGPAALPFAGAQARTVETRAGECGNSYEQCSIRTPGGVTRLHSKLAQKPGGSHALHSNLHSAAEPQPHWQFLLCKQVQRAEKTLQQRDVEFPARFY